MLWLITLATPNAPTYNASSRCTTAVCRRVAAMEPTLPIAPPLVEDLLNPCIVPPAGSPAGSPECLPYVHVVSGWHMFADESLGWLKRIKQIDVRNGDGCFDDWSENGATRWVKSFGGPPDTGKVIMTHCNRLLSWYPAFAGRYTSAWGRFYGPCKDEYMKKATAQGKDYYSTYLWPVCRPGALGAHDRAMGTEGAGSEATPPFVLKALYGGAAKVRVLSALRHPVDRLETAFWLHQHYPRHYGQSPQGLHKYVQEQTRAFSQCASRHDARRCAHLFELLGEEYANIFFHADQARTARLVLTALPYLPPHSHPLPPPATHDMVLTLIQVIRSLYEPFVRDWHAALGTSGFLVVRVDDLLDRAAETRMKVLAFLGLPVVVPATVPSPQTSYASFHAASLKAVHAQPMLSETRQMAEAFFKPYDDRLAAMYPSVAWPHGSTVVNGAAIANAIVLPGAHFD